MVAHLTPEDTETLPLPAIITSYTPSRTDPKRTRVLRPGDHRLGWQDRERAQSVRLTLERRGWQFALSDKSGMILAMSDARTQWYLTGDHACSCPARKMCKHRIAVEECGGVKALCEALERWP